MNSSKLSWGIVGTGRIARSFAKNLSASRTGQLVAVGSRSEASAKAFADEFPGTRAYGSYQELLDDVAIQAVYIATPHPHHAEWAIKAAQAGKHILCEKPVTLNRAEAMAVLEAARHHGVFFMEAFMYRCHPQIAKVLEIIRSGEIGAIRQIHASFAFGAAFSPESRLFRHDLGGGAILDVGCYPVSLVRLIAGAAVNKPFDNPLEVFSAGTLCEISKVDVHAAALMRFSSGILAQVSTGINGAHENTAVIMGEHGSIRILSPWVPDLKAELEVTIKGVTTRLVVEADRPLYSLEADVVAAHLGAGEAPEMPLEDTLGNMVTLDRWRSALFIYDQERDEASRPALPRIRSAEAAPIPNLYRQIPGFEKPISKMVMGTDLGGRIIGAPDAFALFDYYTEHGGNCFDTAFIYGGDGYSEKILGQWMKQRNAREDLHLIVKGAHTPYCFPDKLVEQFHISLERLQVERTDFYMLHRDNPDVPVEEFVDVLNAEVQAGRIGCFGGSNWSIERIKAANEYAHRKGLQGFGCLSNQFSLATMEAPLWAGCISSSDPASREWLTEQQMPLFAWSSQARGFFVRADREDRRDGELVQCWYSDDNFERLKRARALAARYCVDPIHIAAAYVLAQPFPLFALIGPRALAEMSHSFKAFSISLSPEECRWLNLEGEL